MLNIALKAILKMHLFRYSGVSTVLESSCMTYTLRFCARYFLALPKKVHFKNTFNLLN